VVSAAPLTTPSAPTAALAVAIPIRANPALVKALARAFRYQRMLDEGRYSTIPKWQRLSAWTAATWGGCYS
jgi:hypothetical protein